MLNTFDVTKQYEIRNKERVSKTLDFCPRPEWIRVGFVIALFSIFLWFP